MKRDAFLEFLRSVFDAYEQEMVCSEFFDALPRYVDWVVAGRPGPVDERLTSVEHHIGQCKECREAYAAPNPAGLAAHSMLALRHPRSHLGTGQEGPP